MCLQRIIEANLPDMEGEGYKIFRNYKGKLFGQFFHKKDGTNIMESNTEPFDRRKWHHEKDFRAIEEEDFIYTSPTGRIGGGKYPKGFHIYVKKEDALAAMSIATFKDVDTGKVILCEEVHKVKFRKGRTLGIQGYWQFVMGGHVDAPVVVADEMKIGKEVKGNETGD